MTAPIILKGITWNHSRGYVPKVATAQRFSELHPGLEIVWEKRSLQAFADYPLQNLVDSYDLLIIDHPFVGYAASHTVLLPLDEYLPAAYLQDQAANSVGKSHQSYSYNGHQWALATDAASPVAMYRADLLKKHGLSLPETWQDVLELARSGKVIVPGLAVDSLMHIYYLCASWGLPLFEGDTFVSREEGIWALEQLHKLISLCPPECLERNPIKTHDALAAGDSYVYCPFAYGYSNYGRRGYAEHLLAYTDVVSPEGKKPGCTTLGGTGIAVSSYSLHKDLALDYVRFINDPVIQRTLYVENGGQPGHRSAWVDDRANLLTNNFFKDTLTTLDHAYLRPRYDGYLYFQDKAALVVHDYLHSAGSAKEVWKSLQALYIRSLKASDVVSHDG